MLRIFKIYVNITVNQGPNEAKLAIWRVCTVVKLNQFDGMNLYLDDIWRT